MKKIIVTGSEGEVGTALLPQLAKRFDAVGFDRRPHDGPMDVIQGDLLNADEVTAAADGADAVVHVAALLPNRGSPAEFVDLNVKATANVLQAAVDRGVKRFVYCSTVWASGHGLTEPYMPIDEDVPCVPICMYGQTKWLGELMTEYYGRELGLETVVIHFCGFRTVTGYDADGRINWAEADLPTILDRHLGRDSKLTNPVDLGEAFGRAIEKPEAVGERIVVGSYTPYSSDDRAELKADPRAVVERYYPGAVALFDELGIDIPAIDFYYSHEKAQKVLGFRSQYDLGDFVRLHREWQKR